MQGVAGSWTSDPNGPSLSFRYRNSRSKPGFMTSYVWETRKAVGTGGVTAFFVAIRPFRYAIANTTRSSKHERHPAHTSYLQPQWHHPFGQLRSLSHSVLTVSKGQVSW